MRKVLCKLGLHKWDYSNVPVEELFIVRRCVRCKVLEKGIYDMCYGGTIWYKI